MRASEVRDLKYRFRADGREYLIEVCAPGSNPALAAVGPFDVHIAADVPAGFADDPDAATVHVITYVKPLVPPSVSASQWFGFASAVLAWAHAHRTAAALVEWELERHEYAWQPFEIWRTNESIAGFASCDEHARRKLERDATLLHTVYGENWEEAMAIIKKHYGIEHCAWLSGE